MQTCVICTETYNTRRKAITCYICKKTSCMVCVDKYIIDVSSSDHCMFCKNKWNIRFIYENLTKSCIDKMRVKTQKLLYSAEEALLPMTHKYIEYNKYILELDDIDKDTSEKISKINVIVDKIERELQLNRCPNPKCSGLDIYYRDRYCHMCKKNICTVCRMVKTDGHICNAERKDMLELYNTNVKYRFELHKYSRDLKIKIRKWRSNYDMNEEVKEDVKIEVLCKCPNDSCKGLITNKTDICVLCNRSVCVSCHMEKEENHVCKEENIKSIDMITRTTKACPKCGVSIDKIDGCNQMWCIKCYTAFNWVTNKIVYGHIHNPHYFEWFRKRRDELHPRTCEGVPDERYYTTHTKLVFGYLNSSSYKALLLYYKILLFVQEELLQEVKKSMLVANLDLRLAWVQNELSDDQFKQLLYRRYKKKQISVILRDIFQTFVVSSCDIAYRIMDCNSGCQGVNFIQEWTRLIEYTNSYLLECRDIFKMKMPCIVIQDTYNNFNITCIHYFVY